MFTLRVAGDLIDGEQGNVGDVWEELQRPDLARLLGDSCGALTWEGRELEGVAGMW